MSRDDGLNSETDILMFIIAHTPRQLGGVVICIVVARIDA